MKHLLIILLFIPSLMVAQSSSNPYEGMENLIGGRWITKGTWTSGKQYHQEIEFEWELSKKIITAKTFDFVDATQFDKAMRNYGIRAWDKNKGQLTFSDFDVFGGVTSGSISVNGKNIYYSYPYLMDNKPEILTDGWIYKDDNTYIYKVGIYRDGAWQKVFLESVFYRTR